MKKCIWVRIVNRRKNTCQLLFKLLFPTQMFEHPLFPRAGVFLFNAWEPQNWNGNSILSSNIKNNKKKKKKFQFQRLSDEKMQ